MKVAELADSDWQLIAEALRRLGASEAAFVTARMTGIPVKLTERRIDDLLRRLQAQGTI